MFGAAIGVSSLAAHWIALTVIEVSQVEAGTIAFLTIRLAQLFHVLSMRGERTHPLFNKITSNPDVWGGGVGLCVALFGIALILPGAGMILALKIPRGEGGFLILGFSGAPALFGQAMLAVRRDLSSDQQPPNLA